MLWGQAHGREQQGRAGEKEVTTSLTTSSLLPGTLKATETWPNALKSLPPFLL